jgi:hypothetical protein
MYPAIFGQHARMPNDPNTRLALRQADQARADFAEISDDLDFLRAQLRCRRGRRRRGRCSDAFRCPIQTGDDLGE